MFVPVLFSIWDMSWALMFGTLAAALGIAVALFAVKMFGRAFRSWRHNREMSEVRRKMIDELHDSVWQLRQDIRRRTRRSKPNRKRSK